MISIFFFATTHRPKHLLITLPSIQKAAFWHSYTAKKRRERTISPVWSQQDWSLAEEEARDEWFAALPPRTGPVELVWQLQTWLLRNPR